MEPPDSLPQFQTDAETLLYRMMQFGTLHITGANSSVASSLDFRRQSGLQQTAPSLCDFQEVFSVFTSSVPRLLSSPADVGKINISERRWICRGQAQGFELARTQIDWMFGACGAVWLCSAPKRGKLIMSQERRLHMPEGQEEFPSAPVERRRTVIKCVR